MAIVGDQRLERSYAKIDRFGDGEDFIGCEVHYALRCADRPIASGKVKILFLHGKAMAEGVFDCVPYRDMIEPEIAGHGLVR